MYFLKLSFLTKNSGKGGRVTQTENIIVDITWEIDFIRCQRCKNEFILKKGETCCLVTLLYSFLMVGFTRPVHSIHHCTIARRSNSSLKNFQLNCGRSANYYKYLCVYHIVILSVNSFTEYDLRWLSYTRILFHI